MGQPVRYKSTADYVTVEIQRLILSGQLQPGARVDQIELATQLDVSRHPVRQAIERLAERGFIVLHPHRSAVVATISLDDMDELYSARRILETWAVREGWERLDDGVLRILTRQHEIMCGLDPQQNLEEYMEANRSFHLAMYQPCNNRHVIRTITNLFDISERYQRTGLIARTRSDQSKSDHGAILAALAARDLPGLIAAMEAHNTGTQAAVRNHIASLPQSA